METRTYRLLLQKTLYYVQFFFPVSNVLNKNHLKIINSYVWLLLSIWSSTLYVLLQLKSGGYVDHFPLTEVCFGCSMYMFLLFKEDGDDTNELIIVRVN